MSRQKSRVEPIPFVAGPGADVKVELLTPVPTVVFGALCGDPGVEPIAVAIGTRAIPFQKIVLYDRSWFLGVPTIVVHQLPFLIILKAERQTSGEIEILYFADRESPAWLEAAKQKAAGK